MKSIESNIIHETANLYLYDTGKGLEIRLNRPTHAVVIGKGDDAERCKRVMEKLERYPRLFKQL